VTLATGLDAHLVTMVDGVAFGLVYFCLAAGLAIIFGAADVLNLAHGTLYLGGALLAWRLADGSWLGLALAVLCALAAGAAAGGLLSAMTAPLAARGHLDQALLTLGVSLIGAEAFAVSTGGEPLPAAPPAGLAGSLTVAGYAYPVYRLVFIGVAALLALGIHLVIERSRLGSLVRATVADREMVAAMGYRPALVLAGLFAAGGALAVTAGTLAAPLLPAAPGVDEHVLVMSLVVIVIGGIGSIRATLLGALVVGQVDTLGRTLLPAAAGILLFAVMALALVIRPGGVGARLSLSGPVR
jgi:branched-chain amino acid transport system permease protein